ncbi:MAG: glycosyltransferase family 2 protein [Verrucomicrobia bacterium]|nr:glycosyltransferase family 2 protein [Verrucomicrobiota bacterium]
MTPQVTTVIPGFNRVEPLKYTLRSVAAAVAALPPGAVETILVDDGSVPSLEEQLAGFTPGLPIRHVRQPNQGSIVARLTGLRAARGRFVLFLDSDDLIHPDKFKRQLAAMEEAGADVSYSDMARATLGLNYTVSGYAPDMVAGLATAPADFFLRIQPAPHSPIYRRAYLDAALPGFCVPPLRALDAVGDLWLYYNLSPFPARIVKVDAPLTAVGPHEEDRFSRHWEKLAVAALLLGEAFLDRCPVTPATLPARIQIGETAFNTWRRLSRDYHAGHNARLLALWRRAPRGPLHRLGGPGFRLLARLLGPVNAGRVLRLRNASYAAHRTVTAAELDALLAVRLPAP